MQLDLPKDLPRPRLNRVDLSRYVRLARKLEGYDTLLIVVGSSPTFDLSETSRDDYVVRYKILNESR